jgi:hypothetical protein
MTVMRGTTYNLHDALSRFTEFYSDLWVEHAGGLIGTFVAGLVILLVVIGSKTPRRSLIEVLAVLAIFAILAGMMLPALAKAKQKSTRISAVNNLKQIGIALRIFADENNTNRLPIHLEDARNEYGQSDKLLVDPESGERFIYVGAGKTLGDPNVIIAFSPYGQHGRAVLLGDGSVQQMSSVQFAEAERREEAAHFANPPPPVVMSSEPLASRPAFQNKPEGMANGAVQPASAAVAPEAVPAMSAAGALETMQPVNEAVATAAMPAPTPPTAAGLRSIHIDIPRLGQPFTFTKVLNTGGEPLTIKMSVMNSVIFAIIRSGLQTAAFLCGLLLVWWQCRHNRSSLMITLGTALAIGSVGALLISGRVLHLAFIAAVPLVVLAALIWGIRKIVPRKPADSTPTPPPMGPAVAASILLLLILAGAAQAQDSGGPSSSSITNRPASVSSASYTGTITEHVAQFEASLLLTSFSTNQTVPLFGDDVALEDFSVKTGSAKLMRTNGRLSVLLPGPGESSVSLKFVVKLGGDVSKRQLSFAIPAALVSRLDAAIDEPDADVEFPAAVAFNRTTAAQQTRIAATIGSSDCVKIQWTPRTKRAAEVAATIFVDNNSLATFVNGVMDMRSTLDYQITQGELRQARVQLPAGQRLLRVDGESIRTWQLEAQKDRSPASGDVLAVDLLKGISPNYRLSVETEKILDTFPATCALEIPHALGVKRETGLVAVRGNEELSLSVDHATELQRADAAEFKTPDGAKNLFSVWRFLTPAFSLAIKAETVQPQIEAVVHNNVRISTEECGLFAQVDYNIKRAGVFVLQLALPAGYTLSSVQGDDILQWQSRDKGSNRVLEVSFKNRKFGAYSLHLELLRLHKELPPTLAIPGVQPLSVEKLSGFISVASESGVSVKTANFDGLTEIPAANLGVGASTAAGVLAYKFLNQEPGPLPNWKLELSLEKIDSWVRAEIAQVISISDNLLNGSAIIRYDIQNAPVREFLFKIPAAYTNIEFNCPNIRRRDHTNDGWSVELQNAVHGQFVLTVTWEEPVDLKTNTLDLPGVRALGVERESGFVVVRGKADLQITEKTTGAELTKIDAAELPAWIGSSDGPVLAWRYVHPGYELTVEAKRFADAAVLQALADQVRLTSVVAQDGQAMTVMTLAVRNNGLQHLEVELPPGSTVWSAFVGGEAVRPALSKGKLLLPLETGATDAGAPVPIEVTYIGSEKFPKGRGEVNLISPRLGVPLNNVRWDLYLPPDYDYSQFAGSMTHEAQSAPIVQSYSLSEYRAQEAEKTETKQTAAKDFISNVRRKLASGDVSGINRFSSYDNYAVADADSRSQLDALKKDIDSIQAGNLRQQQRVFSNSNNSQAPASNDGELIAQAQWTRLAQAQELAVARVRPLHVNLPVSGLHQGFTQVLQTGIEKPLTIQFTAANNQADSRGRQFLGGVLALLALWAVVKTFLIRSSRKPQSV